MPVRNGPLRIALLYTLLGVLWILLSDKIVLLAYGHKHPHLLQFVNSVKGFAYVFITAWLLFILVKRHSREAINTEKRYRSFFADNPDPMWIYESQSFRFLEVNDAAVAHYGFSRQEFLGMTLFDIRPESEMEPIKTTLAGERPELHDAGVWTHKKKDGAVIYVHITSHRISGSEQKVMVLAKDITDVLLGEKKLRAANDGLQLLNKDLDAQQKQLSDIQQLAKLGGWEYFPQTGNMVCSDEIYYILDFAWPGEPDPWKNITDHVHPGDKDEFEKNIDTMLASGNGFSTIFRIIDDHRRLKYLYIIANKTEQAGRSIRIRGTLQDITQSKELEEKKNLYLLRLENTLNSISDAFCVLDEDWVIRAVNPMFERIAGFPRETMLNHKITEFWPVTADNLFYSHLSRSLQTKETLRFELFSERGRWYRVVAYPTREGVAFYFTDITEGKEKDIQLKRALERYDLAARATEDMFYEFDIRENRLTYSQGMDGIPNPSSINDKDPTKAWFSIVHPDDLPKMMEANQKSLRERSPTYECEYRIDFGHHNYRYVWDKAYIQYENNEPVRQVGAIRDINELKKTAEENKLLSRVISHVTNKIMITDVNRRIVWVNQAFQDVSGYSLEEILNGRPQDFIGGPDPDPALLEDIRNRHAKHEVFSKELVFYHRDGSVSWVKGDFTPLYNADNEFTGYITVYANINELKQKQASLETQNATLREIAWLESHEMRRPLASILGLVELIKGSTDESEKKYLFELLDTSAKDLDTMVMKISQKIHESMSQAAHQDRGLKL